MKKLLVLVAAMAIAVAGFGALGTQTTQAHPTNVWVINANVANAMETLAGVTDCDSTTAGTQAPPCDLTDPLQLATFIANVSLDDAATASGGQVGTAASTGNVWVVAKTDGSATDMTLNPKGLTAVDGTSGDGLIHCTDLAAGADTDCAGGATGDDGYVVFTLSGPGSNSPGDSLSLDVVQDTTSLSADVSVVGTPHDISFSAVLDKTTVQEAASSCGLTDSISAPTRAGVVTQITDIDGTSLAGIPNIGFKTSSSSTAELNTDTTTAGLLTSEVLADGTTIGDYNVVCGVNAGTATISTTIPGAQIGESGTVTKTLDFTVTGVPANIALTADPAAIACDGTATSTVTAKVTDSAGNDVVDGTGVTFSVVALGTANPIQTTTTGGSASSTITPLSGGIAGTTVVVQSGDVQASIRIDCLQPTPTVPAGPVPTSTPTGGIVGPNTGTGGYLGQDSTGSFSMWTLIALAMGSVALVAGGMVTRRAGK